MAEMTENPEELPPTLIGPAASIDAKTVGKLVMETHSDIAYPLKKVMIIGREASGLDIDLHGFKDAKYVSSRHAKISLGDDQRHYLEDLESSNHTYVNNRLIEPHKPQCLKQGDVLRFGKISFVYFEK